MQKRFMVVMAAAGAAAVLAALVALPQLAFGQGNGEVRQPGAVYDFDFKGQKSGPAPKRDISGVWEPASGPGGGINANGAQQMPSDGKPEHELPFTPEGK